LKAPYLIHKDEIIRMKKCDLFLVMFLVGIILHLGSTNSYSSFLITLKTGRTIYAENYRMEGEDMVLYFRNGILKISKDEVQSIFEEKGEIKEEKGEIGKNEKDTAKNCERNTPAEDLVGKKGEIEYYKRKKLEISERLEEAKKTYFNTTDKSDKDRARKIMISISGECFALEEEVIKKIMEGFPNGGKNSP
jgi:hypothetical protein